MKLGFGYHLSLSVSHHAWHAVQQHPSHGNQATSQAFERFDPATLDQALTQLKLHFWQSYTLTVAADFCTQQIILLDAIWQERAQTQAFLQEVQAEMAHELDQLEDYFWDARPLQLNSDGLEVEVFLLAKTKVSAYLKACQAKHLRLSALHVDGEANQGLNLFPWRQQINRRQQQRRALRLSLLPVLMLLLMGGGLSYEQALLSHQQKTQTRLQKQEAQYLEANPDSFKVLEILPILNHLNQVDRLQMNAEGQIEVSGVSANAAEVSPQLQSFGEQAAIEKNALHELKVQTSEGKTHWQADFQLLRSAS